MITYHPQTDGMIERFNRTLLDMLSKTARADPRTWDQHIPYVVLFAYRTSPHDSTGVTPIKLLYGHEAILPTDELLTPPIGRPEAFLGTYVEEMTNRMGEAWALAQQNLEKAQAKQKRQYDKKLLFQSLL